MAKAKQNFEVVKKCYIRKNGVLEENGYDWIGRAFFELYPVELDGKLGFIDCNGKIVIPTIYDTMCHVNDTIWTGNSEYLDLRKNNLYGLIKHDGTIIVDFCWNGMELSKLKEELLPVSTNDKWGFVNIRTGKVQIEPAYDEVEFFKNGFAPVRIGDKWGIIDSNGNVIVQPKYLLDSHFVGDFAIVFEGGSYRYEYNKKYICGSNCKVINTKGTEIIKDCSWIEKTGIDTFTLTRTVDGKDQESIKHLIKFSDYILVIDGGKYLKGYISPEGKYSEKYEYAGSTCYENAKYIGGGTLSAIDFDGNLISISDTDLQKMSFLA